MKKQMRKAIRRGYEKEGRMVEREGFEPSKAEPSDLQSDPFGRSGTPPKQAGRIISNDRIL